MKITNDLVQQGDGCVVVYEPGMVEGNARSGTLVGGRMTRFHREMAA
jgi:hypothetical protein